VNMGKIPERDVQVRFRIFGGASFPDQEV